MIDARAFGLELAERVGFDDFALVYLRHPSSPFELELTVNFGRSEPYDLGNGYGHIAIEVDDAYKTCEEVKKRGGKVTREPGPMKHGTTVIAFVEDPDGYKIEFVQRKTT